MLFLLRLMKTPRTARILDYGGGLGIVPRLLRETGYNAFCYDTYTTSSFPDVAWTGDTADVLMAVELFEHLGDPAGEIARMFAFAPDWFYVRTWRYFGQDRSWDYIAAHHGQHTFFYTDAAMRMIAERHGYTVHMPTEVDTFFSRKPLSSGQKAMMSAGLKREPARRMLNGLFRLSGR
jgi:Methyltransferase domain